MAETIHGTKANAIGPAHKADQLCATGDCEACATRIFALHLNFFRDEFKGNLVKQHGAKAVCSGSDCIDCWNEKHWDTSVVCPGCDKNTGKVRTGVLAAEIFQVHQKKDCEGKSTGMPIKKCACPIHVKMWLICSLKCQLASKYAKAVPEAQMDALKLEYEKKQFCIPPMGPMLVVDQYRSPSLAQ